MEFNYFLSGSDKFYLNNKNINIKVLYFEL